jgi:hypothetical protein
VSDATEAISTIRMLADIARKRGEQDAQTLEACADKVLKLQLSKDPSAWDHPNKETIAWLRSTVESQRQSLEGIHQAIIIRGLIIACQKCAGHGYYADGMSSEQCDQCAGRGWTMPFGSLSAIKNVANQAAWDLLQPEGG